MAKSTTLGMIVGGLAPLLVLKLTMEYDKKNMPKQEPKQKVAIQPTPTQNKSKTYSKECMDSLNRRLMQEDVKKPNFENDFLENCAKNEKK